MRWPEDAEGWPLTDLSRIIDHRPHRWHVQIGGTGRDLLLLHGAGGATQSWRGLLPALAEDHRVIALDLPGQGFTRPGRPGRFGLDAMAEDILSLCHAMGWQPAALIGHSAGAAIALRMVELMGERAPPVIGLNAALGEFEGAARILFPTMAKALAFNPLTSLIFTTGVSDKQIRRLIASTGSTLDDEGIALYRRLASDRAHVDGTLKMMAAWRLGGLLSRLSAIASPVRLIVGADDGTVPPRVSARAAEALPDGQVITLPGLGHLAHEEAPQDTARAIRTCLAPLLEPSVGTTDGLHR